jgi:hypothetical protein
MAIFQRDTTLTSDLLRVITSLPNLTKLEINGHSSGSYDPRLLCGLASTARTVQEGGTKKGLKDLRLILPDRAVAEVLLELVPELAGKKGGEDDGGEDPGTAMDCGLTGLEIISQVRSASLYPSAVANTVRWLVLPGRTVYRRRPLHLPRSVSVQPPLVQAPRMWSRRSQRRVRRAKKRDGLFGGFGLGWRESGEPPHLLMRLRRRGCVELIHRGLSAVTAW